jgi:1-acyl-sn-glycerol-3-phosphate acyltransferase
VLDMPFLIGMMRALFWMSAKTATANSAPPARSPLRTTLVAIWRGFAVAFFCSLALLEILLTAPLVKRRRRMARRANWMHGWCDFACGQLAIHPRLYGKMPPAGLLICNHLSYIDIIVLSGLTPCHFVAKDEIAGWPLFGWLARVGGTIFVDRTSKFGATKVIDLMREAIADGALLVLFPEGTSTNGSTVLPFKSALLQLAVELDCPISVAAIDYSVTPGSPDEVCYWHPDITLVAHLVNLFFKDEIVPKIVVASSTAPRTDRKVLARELREQIIALRSQPAGAV